MEPSNVHSYLHFHTTMFTHDDPFSMFNTTARTFRGWANFGIQSLGAIKAHNYTRCKPCVPMCIGSPAGTPCVRMSTSFSAVHHLPPSYPMTRPCPPYNYVNPVSRTSSNSDQVPRKRVTKLGVAEGLSLIHI